MNISRASHCCQTEGTTTVRHMPSGTLSKQNEKRSFENGKAPYCLLPLLTFRVKPIQLRQLLVEVVCLNRDMCLLNRLILK